MQRDIHLLFKFLLFLKQAENFMKKKFKIKVFHFCQSIQGIAFKKERQVGYIIIDFFSVLTISNTFGSVAILNCIDRSQICTK